MSRKVKNDTDCADCLCRVCARNVNNDSYNPLEEFPNCSCDNCTIGESTVIETTDDCPQFLPDIEDENSFDAMFGGNGMKGFIEITILIEKEHYVSKLIAIDSIKSVEEDRYNSDYPRIKTLIVLNDYSGTYVRCKESYDEIKKAIMEATE